MEKSIHLRISELQNIYTGRDKSQSHFESAVRHTRPAFQAKG
jgi:hypothetical protein